MDSLRYVGPVSARFSRQFVGNLREINGKKDF